MDADKLRDFLGIKNWLCFEVSEVSGNWYRVETGSNRIERKTGSGWSTHPTTLDQDKILRAAIRRLYER